MAFGAFMVRPKMSVSSFNNDGLVKSPTSALCCISVIIQRTIRTPHDYKTVHALNLNFIRNRLILIFYNFIKNKGEKTISKDMFI